MITYKLNKLQQLGCLPFIILFVMLSIGACHYSSNQPKHKQDTPVIDIDTSIIDHSQIVGDDDREGSELSK